MTLTPEKLDGLERLAELATPGPWYYAGCNTVHDADHDEVAHPCDMGNDCATARYIAACDPDTIRELLAERGKLAAEVEALRAEVERLNRILGRIVEGDGDSNLTIRAGTDAFAAAREYLRPNT